MARVKLRRDRFVESAQGRGLTSQQAQADAIGVGKSTHSRALAGHITLSGEYVVGTLKALGDKQIRNMLDELFEIDGEMQVAS
ncbi:hypothetical protein Ssi03_51110 [Sphaerisporangium siamense]|uniref:Putative PilT family ATPase n=1 Tax=Sphaerisporangium siamense TaxID=795645 RepID=A0A7W7DA49_9ACTN|nr:hypothetical protein [Sphaerisporangium siamense]MBB4702185.1 putative PilT family ATPase [Sphaerisporangium siamense]GII87121.1 hypothetical protein Ssi03_51110 [Sphaerisporangium siamense]